MNRKDIVLDGELARELVKAYLGEDSDEVIASAIENSDKRKLEENVEYFRDVIRFSDGNLAIDVPVIPSHRTENGVLKPEVDEDRTIVAVELNTGLESEDALSMADNGKRIRTRLVRHAENYHGYCWGQTWDEKVEI